MCVAGDMSCVLLVTCHVCVAGDMSCVLLVTCHVCVAGDMSCVLLVTRSSTHWCCPIDDVLFAVDRMGFVPYVKFFFRDLKMGGWGGA